MAFEEEEKRADEETLPDTSLHAYGQGREDDIEGDPAVVLIMSLRRMVLLGRFRCEEDLRAAA